MLRNKPISFLEILVFLLANSILHKILLEAQKALILFLPMLTLGSQA